MPVLDCYQNFGGIRITAIGNPRRGEARKRRLDWKWTNSVRSTNFAKAKPNWQLGVSQMELEGEGGKEDCEIQVTTGLPWYSLALSLPLPLMITQCARTCSLDYNLSLALFSVHLSVPLPPLLLLLLLPPPPQLTANSNVCIMLLRGQEERVMVGRKTGVSGERGIGSLTLQWAPGATPHNIPREHVRTCYMEVYARTWSGQTCVRLVFVYHSHTPCLPSASYSPSTPHPSSQYTAWVCLGVCTLWGDAPSACLSGVGLCCFAARIDQYGGNACELSRSSYLLIPGCKIRANTNIYLCHYC